MTDRIVTGDGVGLAVERLGTGPPFLMVHGFTGAKEDLADHAPRFAEHASVALFDHRGHGASDKPRDVAAYTLDRLAADTLAVADALDLGQFTLLGYSMGGMVARRLVLDHPERVGALVLMDTSPGPPVGIDPDEAEFAAQVALTEGMTVLRQILDERQVLGSEADQRVRRERPGYIEFQDCKWNDVVPEAYAGLVRDITQQPDQLDRMRSIACPTLVIVGEQDAAFFDCSHAIAETVPDARLVVVPDAGHSPQFENPPVYFDAVDGFLRQTAGDLRVTAARDAGYAAAQTLRAHDVDTLFTLSGGHLFPLYDGCVKTDVRLVDTRHEQTAAFAAEGWAKVTRRVGVAALTAGPGVTNGVSAITSAYLNGSPVCVIGGRAPHARWGVGSLQELDHVPIVASVTKHAATLETADDVTPGLDLALRTARTPHRGPTFVDVPLDGWGPTEQPAPDPIEPGSLSGAAPDPDAVAKVAALVAGAARPVLMVGGDVYWAGAEAEVLAFAEAARVPVFANDMGRGVVPADHELAFARARSAAFEGTDLVVVAGTPLDFRLGFGSFAAPVVHLADSTSVVARHVELAGSVAGDLRATFAGLADATRRTGGDDWVAKLRDDESARRKAELDRLTSDAKPIDPARVYGELRARLAPDAVVIGDGGDFVSYAGKYIDTFTPGCFLGPGPYGCLGSGTGYALAAALAYPHRQVVVCYGDGAIGFTLGDLDTLVRHEVNVTAIVGNNGIWGLEKHPMQMIFGYDVVAELRPGTRYDLVAEALGGHGELVEEPGEIGPALDRALAHPGLSVVNVLTDPADAYPRSSNLG